MNVLTIGLTVVGAYALFLAIKRMSYLKEQREQEDDVEPPDDLAGERDVVTKPRIIELGTLAKHPRCPACHEELPKILLYWYTVLDAEGNVYELKLLACGTCKTLVPGVIDLEEGGD